MPKITYIINGKKQVVEGAKGETLLQIALDNGVPVEHACGGNGFCTTCMCQVKTGSEHLNQRNDREENMGITEDPDRLSCQATLEGDGEVEVEMEE